MLSNFHGHLVYFHLFVLLILIQLLFFDFIKVESDFKMFRTFFIKLFRMHPWPTTDGPAEIQYEHLSDEEDKVRQCN